MKKFGIKELRKIIGDKYQIISYNGSKTPIVLSCPNHGEFKIRIDHAREKIGKELCPHCIKETEHHEKFLEFVRKGKEIHGNKYIYHEEYFTNMSTKTIITCPKHGDFKQTPLNHTWSKQGCPQCNIERKKGNFKYTKEEIIKMCKKAHGDKYIYDDIIFRGMREKILNIKCPKHGYFDQVAYDHINGFGCEKCKFEKQKMTKEEFIKKATQVHNGFYSYDREKINYVNNHVKVPIICPQHGEFWQIPGNHLLGIGCPYCQTSKLEKEISSLLEENQIDYIQKYHSDWLGRLELDFFLPQYNIAIECQGKQHFEHISYFDNEDSFEKRLERDNRKNQLCNDNGIKLLYYSNLKINYPYEVFEDKELLLNEIRGTNE